MKALFIGLNLNLKEAFVCLLTVNVLTEAIVNVDDLPLNLFSRCDELFSEILEGS